MIEFVGKKPNTNWQTQDDWYMIHYFWAVGKQRKNKGVVRLKTEDMEVVKSVL